jgi:hypothetical protein
VPNIESRCNQLKLGHPQLDAIQLVFQRSLYGTASGMAKYDK